MSLLEVLYLVFTRMSGESYCRLFESLLFGRERRENRKLWTLILERTREGHHQSDEHWNSSKGNVVETSERRGGAHMGFSEGINTLLN